MVKEEILEAGDRASRGKLYGLLGLPAGITHRDKHGRSGQRTAQTCTQMLFMELSAVEN